MYHKNDTTTEQLLVKYKQYELILIPFIKWLVKTTHWWEVHQSSSLNNISTILQLSAIVTYIYIPTYIL